MSDESTYEDEHHKTTLRVPLSLFKRIHQLWQAGQDSGRLAWTFSRAAYMVRLMELGLEQEEKAHPLPRTPRRGR